MFLKNIINILDLTFYLRRRAANVIILGKQRFCTESKSIPDHENDLLTENLISNLLPKTGHRVLILQPARTHGKFYLKNSTEEESLFEARALINTLESWTLVDEERVNIRTTKMNTFFSSGVYENLTENIRGRDDISAVFVNWSYLSTLQKMQLEKDWNKVIYDRFLMVLQIFKLHAKTTEAKLQVQLAQIPYIKSLLYGYHIKPSSNSIDKFIDGISSTTSLEEKYFSLKVKEHGIRAKLKELEENRILQNTTRRKNELPIISVVGYTNAGKTSLIRHLTKDKKVQPKDCFFATLDVTYHDFYMKFNCSDFGMKAIILDSIGFLSEIPTNLIQAFRSTLREAMDADLLIHVVDISNIYWKEQMDFTLKTLSSFNLPQNMLETMITVGTKIDRINLTNFQQMQLSIPNFIPISNLSGENINVLQNKILEILNKNKGYITKHLKIDQSTSIYRWLKSNAAVQHSEVSSDGNKLLLQVIFTPASWSKFQSLFHPTK